MPPGHFTAELTPGFGTVDELNFTISSTQSSNDVPSQIFTESSDTSSSVTLDPPNPYLYSHAGEAPPDHEVAELIRLMQEQEEENRKQREQDRREIAELREVRVRVSC